MAALRMPRFRSSPEIVAVPISRSASTRRRSGRLMSGVSVMAVSFGVAGSVVPGRGLRGIDAAVVPIERTNCRHVVMVELDALRFPIAPQIAITRGCRDYDVPFRDQERESDCGCGDAVFFANAPQQRIRRDLAFAKGLVGGEREANGASVGHELRRLQVWVN